MAELNAALRQRIDIALEKVTDLFVEQCQHGAQTDSLDDDFAACGQFIGEGARNNQQRGLHGIAAALRVLGPCQSVECRAVVRRLVAFCDSCLRGEPDVAEYAIMASSLRNVIKLAEVLYALAFVETTETTQALVTHVVERLNGAKLRNRGWGFFVDASEEEKCALLPTAYTIRALAIHNVDVSGPKKWVVESLEKDSHASSLSHSDLTTAVACLYCLAASTSASSKEHGIFARIFDGAWKVLEPGFGEDIEQNLEYSGEGQNHYVRVPMQLYVLGLAGKYDPRKFGKVRARQKLEAIITAVGDAAFLYPYSGNLLSARTNAIAYEILDSVRDSLRTLRVPWFLRCWEWLESVTATPWFKLSAVAFAAVVVVLSLWSWLKEDASLAALAPEFVASMLMALLALMRRR